MLPVLKLASDGNEHKFSQAVEKLADEFTLSTEERNELLPSGSQAVFHNRVGWARSYLKQAGLLASPKRGFFTITQKGKRIAGDKSVTRRCIDSRTVSGVYRVQESGL